MPRSDPPAGRRRPRREPELRLLLVCGGEKTETAYFKGLRVWLATNSVDIKILGSSRAPDQVVQYARDHCGHQDFDEAWCVVDVDRFEIDGGRVTAALAIGDGAGLQVAVSNPCFEYWLLLHLAEHNAAFARCDAVVARLRKHLALYDKTNLRFTDFVDGVGAAVKRAKRRDPTGRDLAVNPSSGVWRLVEKLVERRRDR